MMTDRVMLHTPVPFVMRHRLRRVSEEQKRTLQAVVQEAIEKYLEWYDWVQAQEKEGKNST